MTKKLLTSHSGRPAGAKSDRRFDRFSPPSQGDPAFLDGEVAKAYSLCEALFKKCSCRDWALRPCDAAMEMVENGITATDEMERIEQERKDAEGEL